MSESSLWPPSLAGARLQKSFHVAHPLTIVNGVLHENPFYTPAEQYLEELAARARARRAVA